MVIDNLYNYYLCVIDWDVLGSNFVPGMKVKHIVTRLPGRQFEWVVTAMSSQLQCPLVPRLLKKRQGILAL